VGFPHVRVGHHQVIIPKKPNTSVLGFFYGNNNLVMIYSPAKGACCFLERPRR